MTEASATHPSPPGAPSARAGIERIPLIPIRDRMFGPLLLKRRWRTFGLWSGIFAIAWLLLLRNVSPGWNAFSLGVMLPGAGFLYEGGTLSTFLAILGLLAFPVAMINWFTSGNMSIVLLAWLGGAIASGIYADTGQWTAVAQVTPILVLALVALWAVKVKLNLREGVARARGHNEAIAAVQTPLLREFPPVAAGPELSPEQLAAARVLFDKALQPLNRWDGIPLDVEQWQLSATRYVLYSMSYQLAALQYNHTPAFQGYLKQAQENLILKNTDKRIWKFWFWENLWGNFDPNPDPMLRDNVMITGWLGYAIGLYETLNDDRRFRQEGALTYRWSDAKQYRYDFPKMTAMLMRNFRRYDFSWYPCEPNLLYSMCNIAAFNALQVYDRLSGTHHWKDIEARVKQSFDEEFMHPDGRVVCLTFNRIGIRAPSLSSAMGEASGLPGMMAMWPDQAERLWHVLKREFLKIKPDGTAEIKLMDLGWDKWDATNYYIRPMVELKPVGALLVAAVEIGDTEAVKALSEYIDRKCGAGMSMAVTLGLRKGHRHDIITKGMPEAWRSGPILAEAEYPDVLVARAVTDGQALDLVLRPGNGAKPVRLGLGRLVPGRRYAVTGASTPELVADAFGKAAIIVDLRDRCEVRIAPQA